MHVPGSWFPQDKVYTPTSSLTRDRALHASTHAARHDTALSVCSFLRVKLFAVPFPLPPQAGPGQAHRRTLLLVAGDHGQTLGGDHGGGSPEEVDSGFVAVDLGALHDAMRGGNGGRSSGSGDNGGGSGSGEELQAGDGTGESNSPVSDTGSGGSDGSSSDSGHSGGSSGSGAQPSGVAPCRAGCSCGVERNQCAPDLPQLDFAASMAALLGVPIPFGNLGSVSAELWGLAAWRESEAAAAAGLAAELRANVEQVRHGQDGCQLRRLATWRFDDGPVVAGGEARLDELAPGLRAGRGDCQWNAQPMRPPGACAGSEGTLL